MIYDETTDQNVLDLDTTKKDLISNIKEIIETHGEFGCGEVEASHSPTVNNQKGNLRHLIEYFNKDTVEVEVYGNWEDSIDAYSLTYEELDIETLNYILELCQTWEENQEDE